MCMYLKEFNLLSPGKPSVRGLSHAESALFHHSISNQTPSQCQTSYTKDVWPLDLNRIGRNHEKTIANMIPNEPAFHMLSNYIDLNEFGHLHFWKWASMDCKDSSELQDSPNPGTILRIHFQNSKQFSRIMWVHLELLVNNFLIILKILFF